jgi:hypothetical protein
VLMLLVAAAPVSLQAQVPATMPPVDSGLVVRAWLDTGQMRGRLLMPMRATDDSVRYCHFPGVPCDQRGARGATSWLKLDDIQHLDVQVGTRWQKGAWIGGIAGGILGGMAAGFAASLDGGTRSPEAASRLGFVIGAAMYGGLGALIGSAFPRFERRY